MNSAKPRMTICLISFVLLSIFTIPTVAQSQVEDIQPGTVSDYTEVIDDSDDPWAVVSPVIAERESPALVRRGTKETSPVMVGKQENETRPLVRTLGALAGVVGLIVFLAWGYRSMAGGRLPLLAKSRQPGLIEVISRTSLTPRQTLSLVRIGPRMILIGQTPDSLRALDVIDDAEVTAQLAGKATRARGDSNSAEFNACLEREAQGYDSPLESQSEVVAPEAQRLANTSRSLKETIKRIQQATQHA